MWVYEKRENNFRKTDVISGKPKTPTPKRKFFYVWKKEL